MYFFLNGIRYKYFVSLSTNTRIVSYFSFVIGSFDFGNLTIKSIVTSFYSKSGGFVY